MTPQESVETKLCAHCQQEKPLAEFKRRSGKRRGATARRGMCKACRKLLKDSGFEVEHLDEESVLLAAEVIEGAEDKASVPSKKKRKRRKRRSKKMKKTENAALDALAAAGTESVSEESVPIESEELEALPESSDEEEPPKKTKKKRKRRKRKSKKKDSEILMEVDEEEVATVDSATEPGETDEEEPAPKKKRKRKRRKKKAADGESVTPAPARVPFVPPEIPLDKLRALGLKPTWGGFIRMRGKTDNGRKWYQEIDTYLAYVLVTEHAAEVVNRYTIRRIYSNKEFRRLILERDNYTCHFCKQYGDTIDHLLPRAKGGHTTPDNCVCACNLCNQSKADKDLEDFMNILELG